MPSPAVLPATSMLIPPPDSPERAKIYSARQRHPKPFSFIGLAEELGVSQVHMLMVMRGEKPSRLLARALAHRLKDHGVLIDPERLIAESRKVA